MASRCPIYAGPVRVPGAGELSAWAERAKAGDRFVYCEASDLIQGDTTTLARELEQAGIVRLTQERRAGGGFNWLATRTRTRVAGPVAVPPAGLDEESAAILRCLKRAAKLDLPCPSLTELTRTLQAVGLELTTGQVRHRFDRLIEAKVIEAVNHYDNGATVRVVTIAETGQRTRLPDSVKAINRRVAK